MIRHYCLSPTWCYMWTQSVRFNQFSCQLARLPSASSASCCPLTGSVAVSCNEAWRQQDIGPLRGHLRLKSPPLTRPVVTSVQGTFSHCGHHVSLVSISEWLLSCFTVNDDKWSFAFLKLSCHICFVYHFGDRILYSRLSHGTGIVSAFTCWHQCLYLDTYWSEGNLLLNTTSYGRW